MGKRLLILGGMLSFAVALLHLGILLAGGPAYRYIGAGEGLNRLAEVGSPLPALITLALVGLFIICGLYALSGAGYVRRLPFLILGLISTGAAYTVRGLFLSIELASVSQVPGSVPLRELIFSGTSLVIGLVHVAGTGLSWKQLRRKDG